MWLCDDDEVSDQHFIEDAIEIFSRNIDCAVVGYKCDRYLNGKFWYAYDDISTIGLTKINRIGLMLKKLRTSPNSFETLQYGIHKLSCCPPSFHIGYRKSIITFFVIISLKYCVHTIGRVRCVKNTSEVNLISYKNGKHSKNVKNLL